jgi:hypothetical protein
VIGVIRTWVSLSLLLFILLTAVPSLSEPGVTVNWGAYTSPLLDQDGSVLGDYCLLQLIWDADRDGIDEPGENGTASGGDRLLDVSYTRAGSFFPGMVSQNTTTQDIGVGDELYVRAWNSREVGTATHYGDTRSSESPLWRVENPLFLAVDATGGESWSTDRLWSPQGILLWRVENTYSAMMLHCGPNPCKDRARIRFSIPGKRVSGASDDGSSMITHAAGSDRVLVRVSVYDASGRFVREISEEERLAGHHGVEWDLRDEAGRNVPSGSYFLSLSVKGNDRGTSSLSRKIVVVR